MKFFRRLRSRAISKQCFFPQPVKSCPDTKPVHATSSGDSAPFLVTAHPLEDRADSDAAGAFGDKWLGIFDPGKAGDVEVNPGSVFDEDFEELGCRNRAAPASAGILDVADVGLDHLGVLFAQGQAPEFFASGGERRVELCPDLIVVGKGSGGD